MKKVVAIFTTIIVMLTGTRVQASTNNEIKIELPNKLNSGQVFEINLNITNTANLYGAQIEYKYDASKIEVLSIEGGQLIKSNNQEIYEAIKDINSNNKARYGFTYLGDYKGQSGAGTLCTIKVKALVEEELDINDNNLNVKLINKNEGQNLTSTRAQLNVIVEKVWDENHEIDGEKVEEYPKENELNNNTNETLQKNEENKPEHKEEETKEESKDETIIKENEANNKIEEDTSKVKEEIVENKTKQKNNIFVISLGAIITIAVASVLWIKLKNKK